MIEVGPFVFTSTTKFFLWFIGTAIGLPMMGVSLYRLWRRL